MIVRAATPDDAATLAEMNTHVQRLHVERRPEIFMPPVASPEIVQFFRETSDDPETVIYIGEVDGIPVGYVLCKLRTSPENPFTRARRSVLVDQISVNPEHRGKGYGKQLMEAAFALARSHEIDRVVLDVWAFNEDACAFYRRIGMSVFMERFEIHLD